VNADRELLVRTAPRQAFVIQRNSKGKEGTAGIGSNEEGEGRREAQLFSSILFGWKCWTR
jgi:hypothetical protein